MIQTGNKLLGSVPGSRRLSPCLPVLALSLLIAVARAQPPGAEGRHFPLDQTTPPGRAGSWSGAVEPTRRGYYQPIQIELPTEGTVTVYSTGGELSASLASPALAGLAVGHLYRLRLSGMPERPGVELYPTIEVLDRLHPPAGQAFRFPVPVEVSAEEIEAALSGRLVTKVIYLEQPQLADPQLQQDGIRVRELPSRQNLLAAADLFGRPMAILRLGGRLPAAHDSDPTFFGNGIGVWLPQEAGDPAQFQNRR